MYNIHIIKNFLPTNEFTKIQEIVFSKKFPYYYSTVLEDSKIKNGFMFAHMLYQGRITSEYYDIISNSILSKLNLKRENLLRLKVNCYTKSSEHVKHYFHTDYRFNHKVLLLNLNDNNGYTEFENDHKVMSKANEAVIFDGNIKHRSVSQTDEDLRININLNYEEAK